MTLSVTIVVLAAGYLLGRLRLFSRLRDHVWRRVVWSTVTGAARQNLYAAAFMTLFPITFVKGWIASSRKRRNPPPPPRTITVRDFSKPRPQETP